MSHAARILLDAHRGALNSGADIALEACVIQSFTNTPNHLICKVLSHRPIDSSLFHAKEYLRGRTLSEGALGDLLLFLRSNQMIFSHPGEVAMCTWNLIAWKSMSGEASLYGMLASAQMSKLSWSRLALLLCDILSRLPLPKVRGGPNITMRTDLDDL